MIIDFHMLLNNVLILYHLKTQESQRFCSAFRGFKIGSIGYKWVNNSWSKRLFRDNRKEIAVLSAGAADLPFMYYYY